MRLLRFLFALLNMSLSASGLLWKHTARYWIQHLWEHLMEGLDDEQASNVALSISKTATPTLLGHLFDFKGSECVQKT